MRAHGSALRTPIQVQAPTPNRGDGPGLGPARTAHVNVQSSRGVRRSPQGETIVDPYVVEFNHDDRVPVGTILTIDGEAAKVETTKLIRGAFGVPLRWQVTAL